jgi:regulator of sigma E protease
VTILYAIIIFAILIFVHEFGHLIAAKSTKIKVNEFALGMGPRLLRFGKGETTYSLRAFPIGGFCKMEGEDEDSEDPSAFGNRPMPARALTLFAGSLMNILLAILLLAIVVFATGEPTPQVQAFSAGSAAEQAGLAVGDTILSIDGQKVEAWSDINAILTKMNEDAAMAGGSGGKDDASTSKSQADLNRMVALKIRHENGEEAILNTPLFRDEDGLLKIGITPVMKRGPGFALRSIGYGARATWNMTKMMYDVLGQLITGRAGMDQLTGPVGIVKAVGEGAKHGFLYILQFTALISLNLGIVNLLPLPALDGGRLIFLVIRRVTGRRISDEAEGRIHFVGFVLLIALMIYITVIDVNRLIG